MMECVTVNVHEVKMYHAKAAHAKMVTNTTNLTSRAAKWNKHLRDTKVSRIVCQTCVRSTILTDISTHLQLKFENIREFRKMIADPVPC